VKPLLRALALLALLAPALLGAQAPAASGGDTPHAAAHRRVQEQFQQALEVGPTAALAFATKRFDAAATLGLDDPARADAFELMAQADLAAQRYREALPLSTEVVRIRRLARPPEHEMLAMALGLNATLLFAADRSEESDAQLRESLEEYRLAFDKDDVRLAQKLEGQAELVQKGFGRTSWVIEMLRQAAAIREADPASSRGKLAETLVELAIHEMRAGEYGACQGDLGRATAVLEAGLAAHLDDEEWKALLVQALVLKSGLAGKLADSGEALRLARQAATIEFADRATRLEMQLTVLDAFVTQLDLSGDLDGAVREEKKILETMAGNADLFASHRLDPLLQSDALLALAELDLRKDDLPEARGALDAARRGLGDSEAVLFAYAELERKEGDPGQALAHYRAALKQRKESASEVTVLFGTDRKPIDAKAARFGGEAGGGVLLGSAEVLVPGAQFGTRAWLRPSSEPALPVGHATNAARLLIRTKSVLDESAFRARASALMRSARLDPQAVLVFVHGFNVTFDEALQRGAQLARDLNFDGPVVVFSWPSQGEIWHYGADRSSADASARRLAEFLDKVAAATGAKKIHVIAHSMGNRVLLPALARLVADPASRSAPHLGEVILAAPAVPEREFDAWLDAIVGHGFSRLTLYASAVDRAMQVGWFREWGTTLAGFTTKGVPLLHAGLQSIDISKAASGELIDLNHDVFASNPVMSEDIRQLLQSGSQLAPERRLTTLVPKDSGAGTSRYWSYEPPAVVRR
jgi:esterase/lipase superfamily enzyme